MGEAREGQKERVRGGGGGGGRENLRAEGEEESKLVIAF